MTWTKLTLCLFCFLLLCGCGEKIEPGSSSAPALGSLRLPLLTLAPVVETSSESYVGSVESLDRAVLVARGSGVVERFLVREGDVVRKDQLLVEIGDDPLRDQLQASEAGLRAAEKQLATARARLNLADQTAHRFQQLWDNQAVTAQEYDQVKTELEVARQQAAMYEEELKRATAAREAASRQSQFSLVRAPFSGQVLSLQARPGSTILPGAPLLILERSGQRQARISIPERLHGKILVGTPLTIELPALQRTLMAEVSRVQPGSDSSSRSFDVLVLLPESNDLPTGLYVRARHQLPSEELLLIPDSAVTRRGQLTGIFIARDGVLHFRLVKLGRRYDNRWEVLSGLRAGDVIVSDQVEKAVDGASVES